jgi:PAT family beta-lactamase induction signal transducer AmpG
MRPAGPAKTGRHGRAKRLALLCSLYFVQGLPFGFQAKALPILLRETGMSLAAIGFAGALSLPWLLKILWAPLVDRPILPGLPRRKGWILPTQGLLALTCLGAGWVDPVTQLPLLLALVGVMNLFAATQDVAVDGLAVDILGEDELGPGNAAQVVGYKLGMLTGGGLLVWLALDWLGWSGVFFAMSLLITGVGICVLFTSFPNSSIQAPDDSGPGLREIYAVLRKSATTRTGALVLAMTATYKMGEAIIDRMFTPFLIDQGFTAMEIGQWVGSIGMGCSIAGSIVGGLAAMRTPLPRALLVAAILRLIPLAAETLLPLTTPTASLVIAITSAEHFFGGALTTIMFATMMSSVNRRIGGTHFTALAVIEVLGKSPGAWASGMIADQWGYFHAFAIGLLLSLGFVGLAIAHERTARRSKDEESRLHAPPPETVWVGETPEKE